MQLPDLQAIEAAAALIYESMQASPQITWPLLNKHAGLEVWVKHENHNPTGAFKVRGGLTYVHRLVDKNDPSCRGLCAATRGNHGQSIAFAASKYGLSSVILVPKGNNPEKNLAMQAFGAELIEYGNDFDTALERAQQIAAERDLHFVPSIAEELVLGVATCAWEFFSKAPPMARIYVSIGLGSGVCGAIAAKKALGIETQIIGVVAANANAYQLSLAAGQVVPTNSADTIADGLAIRKPSKKVLALIQNELEDIVSVDEAEILAAIRCYFTTTHNIAEGAAAAALAGLLKDQAARTRTSQGEQGEQVRQEEQDKQQDQRVGVIMSGGNIQQSLFAQALSDNV